MLNEKIYLPVELYEQHLKTIKGIKFTSREIDVLACMINGRTAKTIPSFLSISPKTVTTHMANIRGKTGCTSRESVIDFLEDSEKLFLIKHEYYSSLVKKVSFEPIAKLNN